MNWGVTKYRVAKLAIGISTTCVSLVLLFINDNSDNLI